MKRSILKITVLLLLVGLNWAGLSAILETFAYFSDTENSNTNIYQTGTLDFSLSSPVDFSPDLDQSQTTSNRTINVSKDGSLGFQYRVKVESATGGLCSYLELTDDLLGSSFQWLSSFVSGNTTFSNKSSWTFTARSSSFDPSLQGTICNFKLIFEGWQENIANYGDGGFSDTEEVESTIKMGYWNPPVVLNEFLPNAGNYPEFIEIYNKTASPINLNGFYIKANGNIIPINTTTTSAYSGGSTEIPANGWLVVTTGGDEIDDSSGTVALYNPNDVEVDSYTYDASDYNVNNTPGWTNNLVGYWPFDGDLGDKSGNGNNGTNYGATFTAGKINQGLSFDGVNDYVNCGNDASLNIRYELTMEAWIKPDTVLKSYYHSSIVDHGNSYWFLILNTGELAFLRFNQDDPPTGYGCFSVFSTIATIPTGTWTHVAVTYDTTDGNAVKLYIGGQLSRAGNFVNGPIDSSLSSLSIGERGNLHHFDGKIDEVKVYNRVLDSTEVLDHYNAVGVSGSVPLDKSYARIPDGTDNWVDPIPTPGSPNRLSGGGIGGLGWQEELTGEPISENISEETPIVEEPPANEEIVLTEEIVSADEEVTTTTDETEDATTTEEATTPSTGSGQATAEATTTEATSIEEATTTEEVITEATTTQEEITTTTDEVIITEETTTTEEIIIAETTTTDENALTTDETSEVPDETIEPIIEEATDEAVDETTVDVAEEPEPEPEPEPEQIEETPVLPEPEPTIIDEEENNNNENEDE